MMDRSAWKCPNCGLELMNGGPITLKQMSGQNGREGNDETITMGRDLKAANQGQLSETSQTLSTLFADMVVQTEQGAIETPDLLRDLMTKISLDMGVASADEVDMQPELNGVASDASDTSHVLPFFEALAEGIMCPSGEVNGLA